MSVIQRLRASRAIKQTASVKESPKWLFTGLRSVSGIDVDEATAMRLITVNACVRKIAQTLASLPLKIYESAERGKKERRDHPAWDLLLRQPNPMMTAMVFREALISHVVLTGNAFAWIDFDITFRPRALWLLRPDLMRVEKVNGELRYYVRPETGGAEVPYQAWQILHVPGLGFDGTRGYSPIRLAAEGIGLALAQERFGASLFGRGARPASVLQTDKELSDEAYDRLKEDMAENEGIENANKTLILEEGLKWQQVTIAPNDAQFLESRTFQAAEICRLFDVPPSMVGVASGDKQTYANVEQRHIEFATLTLAPMAIRLEQELDRKLFAGEERQRLYTKHVLAALMRGDSKTRAEYYERMFGLAGLSPNDIRELEDWNPIDNGDVYVVKAGFTPLERLMDTPQPEQQPPPEDDDEPDEEEVDTEGGAEDPTEDEDERSLARAYRALFLDVGERAARREARALERSAPRLAGMSTEDAGRWRSEFYAAHETFLARALAPVLTAIAATKRAGEERVSEVSAEIAHRAVDRARTCARGATTEPALRALATEITEKGAERFCAAELARAVRALSHSRRQDGEEAA